MSASVDQRSKGQPNQVSNGSGGKEPEFETPPYLQNPPPQGPYAAAPMNSPNISDQYMSNYYHPYMSFPNVTQAGPGEGAWSNGESVSFLGGYGGHMTNEYMSGNGMFSGGFDYSHPGFAAWSFPGADYSAWGTNSLQQQQQQQGREPDERAYARGYYNMAPPTDGYGAMNGSEMERDPGMKAVEHGLKGMSMNEVHDGGMNDGGRGSVSGGQPGGQGPSGGPSSQAPKKMSWASIASQPARPQPQLKARTIPPAPIPRGKHNMDIGTWDNKGGAPKQMGGQRQAWGNPRGRQQTGPYNAGGGLSNHNGPSSSHQSGGGTNSAATSGPSSSASPNPVLEKLRMANQYNQKEFNLPLKGARYFVIKSYSEDDIHRSIKYSIWCSTEHGNKNLDSAYREREGKGPVYLLYSVNGSGHFCGMAQMMSPVNYNTSSKVWAQDKWKGQFEVKWIYVKDVPNSQLRHIRLENNENKPVTNSRDTQEVPPEKGKQVVKILHQYRHQTCIFDDFSYYESGQEEVVPSGEAPPPKKD